MAFSVDWGGYSRSIKEPAAAFTMWEWEGDAGRRTRDKTTEGCTYEPTTETPFATANSSPEISVSRCHQYQIHSSLDSEVATLVSNIALLSIKCTEGEVSNMVKLQPLPCNSKISCIINQVLR